MMRYLLLTLSPLLLFVITVIGQDADSCTPEAINARVNQAYQNYIADRSDEFDATIANVETLSETVDAIITGCTGNTRNASTEGSGTFDDPYHFNQTYNIDGVLIRVLGVIRPGDEIIREANSYNDIPEHNEEYALILVSVECADNRHRTCVVNNFNFILVGEREIFYRVPIITYDDELSVDLLPGNSGRGLIPFIVAEDDTDLRLIFVPQSVVLEYTRDDMFFISAEPPTKGYEVTATSRLNIYMSPDIESDRVERLAAGDTALAFGRNSDGSWLQITQGWIEAELITLDFPIENLPVTSE